MASRGSLDSFKAAVTSDFARPNLFQVDLAFPTGIIQGSAELAKLGAFTIRAANLPASQIGVIEVPFRGRVLKIAGDRTFEPWTITVLNDKGFALRSKFEEWSTKIQALHQNLQEPRVIAEYQSDALVRQYDRQGAVVRSYKFVGIWPSTISAIDLAWDSNDTPEEYTVEFQVQYWTYANDANAGNAVSLTQS